MVRPVLELLSLAILALSAGVGHIPMERDTVRVELEDRAWRYVYGEPQPPKGRRFEASW